MSLNLAWLDSLVRVTYSPGSKIAAMKAQQPRFPSGIGRDHPARFCAGLALAAALIVLAPAPGVAQTNSGDVSGVVKDSTGAVVPGASVVATHAATGTVVERRTDGQGRFFLPALRTGLWNIGVTLEGFAPQMQKG